MNQKEENKIIDNFQIEFLDQEAEQEFYRMFQKLQETGKIKIRTLLLPAPLEVLINEYDCEFAIEYRDIMGPLRGTSQSINIFKSYTKILNNSQSSSNELYITDRYLFCNNSLDYMNLIIDILSDINIKEIKYIVPAEFSGFNLSSYEHIKKELLDKQININIINSDMFHDRFWISDKCGFVSGTSLNGIAKRTSIIKQLDPLDYLTIYREIKKI